MVKVKLYAYLRDNRGKEVDIEYRQGLTIADIANQLEIDLNDVSIIICDGKDDIPSKMKDIEVKEDSLVHFFPPVAGG